MKKLHAQLKDADRFFTLSENVVRMLPREFGVPKMAHLLEDLSQPTPDDEGVGGCRWGGAGGHAGAGGGCWGGGPAGVGQHAGFGAVATTTGSGNVGSVAMRGGGSGIRHPHVTPPAPAAAARLPVAQLAAQVTPSAIAPFHVEHVLGSSAGGVPDAEVEEMPLMERLKIMRRSAQGASAGASGGVTSGPVRNGGNGDKRRRQIISSQSTPSRSPAGDRSPAPSISLENLSIKKKTPQQLSRLCRAGDQKTVASKMNNKKKKPNDEADANARSKVQKMPCAFLDDEAMLSGDASGDEYDDLLENPSLQDFFDDNTQDVDSPAARYGAVVGGHEESPGVMDMLALVRSKRQQGRCRMMDTQSQSFSRQTPDEYDFDDSFLADDDDVDDDDL